MPLKYTLITPPALEPISLTDVLQHSRIDVGDDDSIIEQLIITARRQAENITGRALITQTWKLSLNSFPCRIVIPKPPLQSIASVTYLDTSGTLASLTDSPTSNWILESGEPTVMVPDYGTTWPSTYSVPDAVSVTFVCGYGDDPLDVPAPIRQWMLVYVAGLYESREYVHDKQMYTSFADHLLDSYRTHWIG